MSKFCSECGRPDGQSLHGCPGCDVLISISDTLPEARDEKYLPAIPETPNHPLNPWVVFQHYRTREYYKVVCVALLCLENKPEVWCVIYHKNQNNLDSVPPGEAFVRTIEEFCAVVGYGANGDPIYRFTPAGQPL